jgi:thioredoxin reductase (NADPH)
VAEPIRQPIFFVVDEDSSAVEALAGDLERRFDADYRVVGETSVPAALERLGALHDAGDQVALIICYESMRAMPGSELLARSRTIYPDAKRILVIDYGDQRMLDVIARGMALGHVEHYLTKPWRPRQHLLYPVVGEALVAWTRANWPGFELVRIVGDRWDPASHQLRDALERNNVPYGFYDRDSLDGAGLLQQLDEVPDNPVVSGQRRLGRGLLRHSPELCRARAGQVRLPRGLRPGLPGLPTALPGCATSGRVCRGYWTHASVRCVR